MIEKGFVKKGRVLYPSLDWRCFECNVESEKVGVGYDLAVKMVTGDYGYCWDKCERECSAKDEFYRLGNARLQR